MRYLLLGLTLFVLISCNTVPPKQHYDGKAVLDRSNLHQYPSEQLVAYFTLDSLKWYHENTGEVNLDIEIMEVLAQRKEIELLVEVFKNPKDYYQRRYITYIIFNFDDPRIVLAFQEFEVTDYDQISFYVLCYLAEGGNKYALKTLSDNYNKFGTSSVQLAMAVDYLGEHNYRPAIPWILKGLDAASLNLVGSCYNALKKYYPREKYPDFSGPTEAYNYFKVVVAEEFGE